MPLLSPLLWLALSSCAAERSTDRRLLFARLFDKQDTVVAGGACQDNNEDCENWARGGECDKNVAYMSASCPLSCMTCRNAPSLHERCRRSCSQCPRASGRTGVDAAWLAVPGGVVFEARKQVSGHWERLLAEKHPPNRIDAANGGVVVGAILECFEACAAAKPEPCAADDATSAACEEHCRAHCAAKLAEGYAVR